MRKTSILILFAPKFRQFGCDVGKEYSRRKGGATIHGVCTGPRELAKSIQDTLGPEAGTFWHLHTEEKSWLSADQAAGEELSEIDEELGAGTLGRMVVADRRVGKGFVCGGLCRPDNTGKSISKRPDILPQQYILGLYRFLDHVLETTAPDMVFCYAVAGAPALMLAKMAQARGIPFSRINKVKLGSRFVIDDDPEGRLACVARAYWSTQDGGDHEVHAEAKELLESFRRLPTPPEYMRRNYKRLKSQTPLRMTARAIASSAYHLLATAWYREERRERIARAWFESWVSWRRTLGSFPFAAQPPVGAPFVYFPLHVDPEASTQVLAPMHTDQLAVIEALAKSAPADMQVVVKEHAPMLGRRPAGFYRRIRGLPRATLLGPEHNGLFLVERASIVAVITGTAAWEAMRLGTPTVVIGGSPFLSIKSGVIHEPCLANLSGALLKARESNTASDDELAKYIAACLAESFEMKSDLLWGDYTKHEEQVRKTGVKNIVDGILRREREQLPSGMKVS